MTGVLRRAGLTEPFGEGGLQRLVGVSLVDAAVECGTQHVFRYRDDQIAVAVRLARTAGYAGPQPVAQGAEPPSQVRTIRRVTAASSEGGPDSPASLISARVAES